MRYATVNSPAGKPVLVRIDKNDMATPIGRAFETVGVDPLRLLFANRRSPRRAEAIGEPFPMGRVRKFYSPVTVPLEGGVGGRQLPQSTSRRSASRCRRFRPRSPSIRAR